MRKVNPHSQICKRLPELKSGKLVHVQGHTFVMDGSTVYEQLYDSVPSLFGSEWMPTERFPRYYVCGDCLYYASSPAAKCESEADRINNQISAVK